MTNPISNIARIIPADYDFDKGVIRGQYIINEMIRNILQAPELKVETHANGDKHFMARVQGTRDEQGFRMDDVCDFILMPDNTIKHLFTGSDGEDESDWIFTGQEGCRAEQWKEAAQALRNVMKGKDPWEGVA